MNYLGHAVITVGLAGAITLAGPVYQIPPDLTLSATAGCLTGLVVHPDLDQAEINIRKRPWLIYWWLYGKLISHRSTLSHGPIIGTVGRILFALPFVWGCAYYSGISMAGANRILAFVLGLMAADCAHYVADQASSAYKRAARNIKITIRRIL